MTSGTKKLTQNSEDNAIELPAVTGQISIGEETYAFDNLMPIDQMFRAVVISQSGQLCVRRVTAYNTGMRVVKLMERDFSLANFIGRITATRKTPKPKRSEA